MWEKGVAEALQPDPTRSLSCRAQGAPGAAGSGQAPGSVHACGIRGCEDGIPSLPMGSTWALRVDIAVSQRPIHFQGGFFPPRMLSLLTGHFSAASSPLPIPLPPGGALGWHFPELPHR